MDIVRVLLVVFLVTLIALVAYSLFGPESQQPGRDEADGGFFGVGAATGEYLWHCILGGRHPGF